MADPKEEAVFLDRAARPTRGKRLTKLLDDEVEEDEVFWNQDALKEEEKDDNYEEEAEVADVFDSDFDDDEPEPEVEEENDAVERVRPKKKLIFPGKSLPKSKSKKKVVQNLEKTPKEEKSSDQENTPKDESSSPREQSDEPEQLEVLEDIEVERTIRKSTRTAVIVRQAERDAIRAALQATMKPIKRKKEGEEKKMTQEEMLLEAAETEIMNLRNLERVLAREEEVKKRAAVHKEVHSGPQIRYTFKDGKVLMEFSKGLSFHSEICATPAPYPGKALCTVTGLPAKYLDPKTGLPYATKEAFKIIRERFSQENGSTKKEPIDKGDLYDSLMGYGFKAKRKRSGPIHASETSGFRYGARFLQIPAVESPLSDY